MCIRDRVKEELGFNKDRGDTVSVANAPFSVIDKNDSGIPLWKDPEILSLVKELLKYAAIAAIVAYLMLKVIRPLVKAMMQPPPPTRPTHNTLGGNVNIVSDDVENKPPTAAETLERKLEQARDLAQQDPKIVANIIKDWTGSNAS